MTAALPAHDLIDEPDEWASSTLGVELTWKQSRTARSMLDCRRTAAMFDHGEGASYLAAVLTAHWVATHDPHHSLVLTVAPTQAQLHGTVWSYLRSFYLTGRLPGRILARDQWVDDDGHGLAYSAPARLDRLTGFHQRDMLVVVDCADAVPAETWQAIEAMCTSESARVLALYSRRWSGWNVIT